MTDFPLPGKGDAVVAVPAPGAGPGRWAGAPSAALDDSGFLVAYRVRVVGERGAATIVARSPDGEHLTTVATLDKARFGAETSPRQVQQMLEQSVSVPLRYPPHIAVEELDRDDVVVRIVSTPSNPSDGAKLAEEVLAGVRGTDADGHRDSNGNEGPEPA